MATAPVNRRQMAPAPAPEPAPVEYDDAAPSLYQYIVDSIRQDIPDFADWNANEDEQKYLYRLIDGLGKIPEESYEALDEQAKLWYITAGEAFTNRQPMTGPDGFYEAEAEAEQEAEPEQEAAPEPAPEEAPKKRGLSQGLLDYQAAKRAEKEGKAVATAAPAKPATAPVRNGSAGHAVTRAPQAAPQAAQAPVARRPVAAAPQAAAPAPQLVRRMAPTAVPQAAQAPVARRPVAPQAAAPQTAQAPVARRPAAPQQAAPVQQRGGMRGPMAAADPERNRALRALVIQNPNISGKEVREYCDSQGGTYAELNQGTIGQIISSTRSTLETLYEMGILVRE